MNKFRNGDKVYTVGDIERMQQRITELEAQLKERVEIIEAVAHIGVDIGYGNIYELEERYIDKARELLESKEKGDE